MEAKKKKKTAKHTKPKSRKKTRGKSLGKTGVAKRSTQPKKAVSKPRAAQNWFIPATAPQNSNTQKIILTTLTLGAAGVVGYLGLQFWKKHKQSKATNLDNELEKIQPNPIKETKLPPVIPKTEPYTPPKDTTKHDTYTSSRNDDFPLKKGSKGDAVRQLQQGLIDKYGSSILPKYGADGDFGSETLAALKKKGYPVTVTESLFNIITQGNDNGGSANLGLAEQLIKAAESKSFSSVISLLKKISNKDQYQQVSNSFMQSRLHGVRQTLVNGMLSSFGDEGQKQQIRMEFIRMGLQYRNNKFSLSGFDGRPLVTKAAATVWTSPTESVQVPAMMVIGNEVTTRLDYTLFENNGKYFLIKTEAVKYL